MSFSQRAAVLSTYYSEYLDRKDVAAFVRRIKRRYSPGTLERLLVTGPRTIRRAAALGLGLIGNYECNATLGRALTDADRGVRTLAEDAIRTVWCRGGNDSQQQKLRSIMRLNSKKQFELATERATDLLREARLFAEVWNQRAVAHFGLRHFVESIGDCRETLEINPYHFAAAAGMGQCYLQLGNAASALECFRRALRLNPGLEGVRASVQHLERTLRNNL